MQKFKRTNTLIDALIEPNSIAQVTQMAIKKAINKVGPVKI